MEASRPDRSGPALSFLLGRFHARDRKSTRLNSSHVKISYAVFCLKKKSHIHRKHPYPISPHLLLLSLPHATAATTIHPLSLHDALPIWSGGGGDGHRGRNRAG